MGLCSTILLLLTKFDYNQEGMGYLEVLLRALRHSRPTHGGTFSFFNSILYVPIQLYFAYFSATVSTQASTPNTCLVGSDHERPKYERSDSDLTDLSITNATRRGTNGGIRTTCSKHVVPAKRSRHNKEHGVDTSGRFAGGQ